MDAVLEMMNLRKELALKVEKCLGKTEVPIPHFSIGVSCLQVSVDSFAGLSMYVKKNYLILWS